MSTLLESFPFRILETKDIEENGRKLFRVKGVFQRADEVNANGRIYPSKLMEREHKALIERMAAGESVFMQSDHPDDGIARVENSVGIIHSIGYDPTTKEVVGETDIVPTRKGNDLKELIRAGGKVGISARGYGTTQKGEVSGQKGDVVQEDYRLVTYDFVIGQSTRNAVVNNFTEQARQAIEAILAEEKMDVKTIDLAGLKSARPDLFTAVQEDAKKEFIKSVGETVAEKTKEIEDKYLATLEYGSDGKIRRNGEEVKLTKKSGGRGGDRGDGDPADHVCTEEQLRSAAAKLGFTVEGKKKGKANDDDEDEDMDESTLQKEAKRLGLKLVKTESKDESKELAAVKTELVETQKLVKDAISRLTLVEGSNGKSELMKHILEKTKDERVFKNALIERLNNECKTTAEVDAKYESVKASIERAINEATGGKGGFANRTEEIASGDRGAGNGDKAQKYKTKSGEILEMTPLQKRQADAAGSFGEEELTLVNG